jgi:hypothetical protein
MNSNFIIDELGGTCEVARLCEVSAQAVSQWRNDEIPQARLMYLKVIRPDVFKKLGAQERAPKKAA